MEQDRQTKAGREIVFVTNLSIGANVILIALKFFVGYLTNSLALIADGIHSFSDFATDVGVLLGYYFGAKKPDQKHPYGHGRIETFSGVLIAIGLVVVGGGMIYHAAGAITTHRVANPGVGGLAVAAFAIVVKELLYRATKRVALKYHSPAVLANAWHDRSDELSSLAVLVGFMSMRFGFSYGDQVAAIAVGLMVVLVGLKIIAGCMDEFSESAVDAATMEQVKRIIDANQAVKQWHELRSRVVGREIFLDVHILVEPNLNVAAAHDISQKVEETLREELSRPVNVTIHIEPDVPELRR